MFVVHFRENLRGSRTSSRQSDAVDARIQKQNLFRRTAGQNKTLPPTGKVPPLARGQTGKRRLRRTRAQHALGGILRLFHRQLPRSRGSFISQIGLEKGLEKAPLRVESVRPLLLPEGEGQIGPRSRLSRHLREQPGVLRRRLEEEIQSAHRFLFRHQTSSSAGAQVDQVHQVSVRRGFPESGEVDGGHAHRETRTSDHGQLQGVDGRIGAGGSGYSGAREELLRQFHRGAFQRHDAHARVRVIIGNSK